MRLMPCLMLGLIATSCVESPNRPKIDHTCIVDASLPGCACSRGNGNKFTLSLQECDGHEAVSLEDSKKIKIYIIDLEKLVLELQKPK
jgi:hypothetical protein